MTNVDCNSLVSETYCRTQKPMCYNFAFGNLYLRWQSIYCKDFWLNFNTSGLQCRAWSVSPSIPRLWHGMPHFSWDPNVDAMPAQTPYGSNAKQHIKKHCSNRCDKQVSIFESVGFPCRLMSWSGCWGEESICSVTDPPLRRDIITCVCAMPSLHSEQQRNCFPKVPNKTHHSCMAPYSCTSLTLIM